MSSYPGDEYWAMQQPSRAVAPSPPADEALPQEPRVIREGEVMERGARLREELLQHRPGWVFDATLARIIERHIGQAARHGALAQLTAAPSAERVVLRAWVKSKCHFCRENPKVNYCESCQMRFGWIADWLSVRCSALQETSTGRIREGDVPERTT